MWRKAGSPNKRMTTTIELEVVNYAAHRESNPDLNLRCHPSLPLDDMQQPIL